MKSRLISILLLLPFICLAQHGFLGKSNDIGLNVFDVLLQQNIGLQYKRYLSSHWGVVADCQYQIINKPLLTDKLNKTGAFIDYGSIYGTSYTLGVGFIFCLKNTGTPFPYGNYIGLSAYKGQSNYYEKIDTIPNAINFNNSFYSIRMFIGKSIYIYNNFNLDIGLQLGTSFGTISNMSTYKRNPSAKIPMQYLTIYKSFQSGYENSNTYLEFVFIPVVKLCYIF